jgi:O-antigen/teichoic acid export membrane protein
MSAGAVPPARRVRQPAHAIRALYASPLGRRLLATTFWSAVGESLSKGLLLVSMVMVARILGREGYGEFGIIRTTINMFAMVGGMGLGFTANRYVARFRDTDKAYSGQIIGSSYLVAAGFGLLVALGVFAAADVLAREALGAPQLKTGLQIAAALLFLSSVSGAQAGILQGLEAYRRLAIGGLVQGTLGVGLFAAGAWYFGLNGALLAFLIYTASGVLIYHVLIRAEMRRQGIVASYRDMEKIRPIFWAFSVPAALMGVAVAPFKWLCETMLARSSGFQHLGVFHASMTIASIFLALVSTLNSPLISLTSNLQASGTGERMQYVNLYGSWYVFLVLAAPVVLFPQLPSLVFGPGFAAHDFHAVSLLLILYCGLLVYYQGVMRMVALHGSLWFGLITNLCEGAALLITFYFLRDRGVLGLGIAYICSYAVRIAVSTPFLLRREIIAPRLLFDRYFAATLIALFGLAALQVARLS